MERVVRVAASHVHAQGARGPPGRDACPMPEAEGGLSEGVFAIVSGAWQRDSVRGTHVSILPQTFA